MLDILKLGSSEIIGDRGPGTRVRGFGSVS